MNTILNFFIAFIPAVISVCVTTQYNFWIGIITGVLLSILAVLLWCSLQTQRKKEEIPETLALGYYINFIEPLSERLNQTTEIIIEKEVRNQTFNLDNIKVKIIKGDNTNLSVIKDTVNNYEKFSIKDNKHDKSFSIRGIINNNIFEIIDFPNTLFALHKYLILGFGNKTQLQQKHFERFYTKLHQLIEAEKKSGKQNLNKMYPVKRQG